MEFLKIIPAVVTMIPGIIAFIFFVSIVPARAIYLIYKYINNNQLNIINYTYYHFANIVLAIAIIPLIILLVLAISIDDGVLFATFNGAFFNLVAIILLVISEIIRKNAYKDNEDPKASRTKNTSGKEKLSPFVVIPFAALGFIVLLFILSL